MGPSVAVRFRGSKSRSSRPIGGPPPGTCLKSNASPVASARGVADTSPGDMHATPPSYALVARRRSQPTGVPTTVARRTWQSCGFPMAAHPDFAKSQRSDLTDEVTVGSRLTVTSRSRPRSFGASEPRTCCQTVATTREITRRRKVSPLSASARRRSIARINPENSERKARSVATFRQQIGEHPGTPKPTQRDQPDRSGWVSLAVTVGFEPTVGGYPTQLFESCTFGRSDTSPSSSLRHESGCREPAPSPPAEASQMVAFRPDRRPSATSRRCDRRSVGV